MRISIEIHLNTLIEFHNCHYANKWGLIAFELNTHLSSTQHNQYSSHPHQIHGLRSRFNFVKNSNSSTNIVSLQSHQHSKRNRRLSGTFIPEHHLITLPPSQTTASKNVSQTPIFLPFVTKEKN